MRFLVETVNVIGRVVVSGAMAPVMRRLRLSRRRIQDAEKAEKENRGQPREFLVRHSYHSRAVVKTARHAQLQDERLETFIAYIGTVAQLVNSVRFCIARSGLPLLPHVNQAECLRRRRSERVVLRLFLRWL
jgi:hypothetical protein